MTRFTFLPFLLSVSVAALTYASDSMQLDQNENKKTFKNIINLDDYEKYAWEKAELGDYVEAEYLLKGAAGHGSRLAALFLSREYSKGNFLTAANNDQAGFYKKLYQKNLEFDQSKSTLTPARPEYFLDEFKIKKIRKKSKV